MIPKGRACALHLHPEYKAGEQARQNGEPITANPHDFFDEYESRYAWDIGWQHFQVTDI